MWCWCYFILILFQQNCPQSLYTSEGRRQGLGLTWRRGNTQRTMGLWWWGCLTRPLPNQRPEVNTRAKLWGLRKREAVEKGGGRWRSMHRSWRNPTRLAPHHQEQSAQAESLELKLGAGWSHSRLNGGRYIWKTKLPSDSWVRDGSQHLFKEKDEVRLGD